MIEAKIEQATINDKYLLELIRNQTSITDATLNVLKKSYDDINTIFNHLNEQFQDIQKQ